LFDQKKKLDFMDNNKEGEQNEKKKKKKGWIGLWLLG